jgi:hypothetical protein
MTGTWYELAMVVTIGLLAWKLAVLFMYPKK